MNLLENVAENFGANFQDNHIQVNKIVWFFRLLKNAFPVA
jgi:hypothetical protein